jgi:ribosomal protein L11 methyltransferase
MQWWDVYVQVPGNLGETIETYLQQLGSRGVVTYDDAVLSPEQTTAAQVGAHGTGWTVLYGALPVDATLPVRICALQQFLVTCTKGTDVPCWKLYGRPLRDQDYLTQWHRFFHPISIAQRLVIHPLWESVTVTPPMDRLVIEPGLAFGTGLHPTTRMCLTLLAQCVTPDQNGNILDVGCGSGILSLAALKFGAATAVGIDIDPKAVQEAAKNAALNGLHEKGRFLEGTLNMISGQFTWIAANVFLDPLIEMMPMLAERLAPQGHIMLSGVLESQERSLRHAMQAAQLNVQRRLTEGKWMTLQGQHLPV